MIPFTSITRQEGGSWLFAWAPTGDTLFRVVLAGSLVDTTATNSYQWILPGYEEFPPQIEVVPDGSLALTELYPPRVTLQWYARDGADFYSVTAQPSGPDSDFPEVGVQWVYTFVSAALPDGTQAAYSLTTTDVYGNTSPAVSFAQEVVTPPTFVDGSAAVSYNAGAVVVGKA